ncbi:MAG TPA: methyltransferase domain-containing protein [Kofleriaceae bacterium]
MAKRKPDLDLEALAAELVDSGSREHYSDAALYDYEYRRRRADVTFYRSLATKRLGSSSGGRILDLGCGSGRVTVPLARDGHTVVAMDQMPPMLERLRGRVAKLPPTVAKRITVLPGELCTFSAPGKFDLIIAAFNVVEHLYTRGEVAAFLSRVTAHLAEGGALAFDVQLPDLEWLMRDPMKRWARTKFTDPSTGKQMLYSTNHDYDQVSQIAVIRLYYEPADGKGATKIVKLTQRKFFPAELEALVAASGLRMMARYGDFFWGELTGAAESQVLIVEAPKRPRETAKRR